MKIIVVVILTLFIANFAYSEVSHEVLLEKLNNLSDGMDDIKNSIDKKGVQRDQEREKQSEINNAVNGEMKTIQLVQAEQAVKINIIWGILGTAIGGGGVYSGTKIMARRKNGKDGK